MALLVLVPLLPLLTALIVMTGHRAEQDQNAKAGLFPIIAAFVGALVTLVLVPSEGAITVQLYDPAAIANLAFPIGFYIDRLSAVMMVLITGVTALIYRYSVGYMYQDRGLSPIPRAARHHHLGTALHGVQRQSDDVVYFLANSSLASLSRWRITMRMARRSPAPPTPLHSCDSAMWCFWQVSCWPIPSMAPLSFKRCSPAPRKFP